MGNWFGKKQVVHPLGHDQLKSQLENLEGRSTPEQSHGYGSTVRIQVKMTARELKELMAQVDRSKERDTELGRLILQECFKGRWVARVIAAGHYRVTEDIWPGIITEESNVCSL